MIVAEIDQNHRTTDNLTPVRFARISNVPNVGDTVRVIEPESDVAGVARVHEVDQKWRVVYLEVDWKSVGPKYRDPRKG